VAGSKSTAVPWAVVGFIAGAALGLFWGGNASRGGLSNSVQTSFEDGDVVVRLDTARAVASGFLGR